jgi:hypothetical protein
MCRNFAGTNQFHQGFGVPPERFQVMGRLPRKASQDCLLKFEGLVDIEPKLVTLRPPPRKQTDAIPTFASCFRDAADNRPAALATASLILFSLDVILCT